MTSRFPALILVLCSLFCSQAFAVSKATSMEYARYVDYPKVDYGKPPISEVIKKGEYLVKLGDCAACHTALKPGAKTFAGGLGLRTPFGTFYSPNITPDLETGIGKWSDEDFLGAIHQGKMPHGTYYFPVFPYPYFTKISKEDALAIKAYLFSLKPVYAPKVKNDVPIVLNWRFLQFGWRVLFFDFQQGRYEYDKTKSKEWNRGAYIVQGLGHCGMCHSPLNFLGAEKRKYFLGGGKVDGFYAPNISRSGLSDATVEEIVNALEKGHYVKGNNPLQGPMMEVEHNSLRFFTDADVKAVATYLKTVKSAPEPGSQMGNMQGSALIVGKKIYTAKCSVCHDSGAAGAPKLGDKQAWAPRLKLGEAQLVHNAINGINAMPPKGTCMSCTDAQISDVVKYMMSEGGGKVEDTAPPPKPALKATMALGKETYTKHCASCHSTGEGGAPIVGDKKAWAPILKQPLDVLMTHSIDGYGKMPARGNCVHCKDVEIIAAVKYMAQQSADDKDFSLW